jgi:twinkle protein
VAAGGGAKALDIGPHVGRGGAVSFDFAAEGIDIPASAAGPETKAVCPKCSHTRKKATQKCLNVNLDEGIWNCWHCGWTGKTQDGRQRVRADKPKAYVRPEVKAAGLTAAALAWFSGRGITREVIERNRVTTASVFMPQTGAEVTAIAYPYTRGGEVINCKYRDKDKNFRMASGAERILYGLDDLGPTTVIVEGEMDKLAVEVAGIRACVSVPDGAPAPNTKNIESKFDFLAEDRLQIVDRWVVAVDNDAPGQRLQDELIRRFGAEKCLVATWPDGCKDANDVLMQHGADTLRECIEKAEPVPIVGVFGANDFADEFLRMYDEGVPSGLSTGWECVDRNWRIQPGQLAVVTGIPGHGKSEWVDALCMNLAQDHGWHTALYSPENYPVKLHMMKLAEKYVRKPYNPGPHERMTKAEASDAKDWLARHFSWVMPEKPSLDEIMDRARAMVFRQGIRCLVIDPWNEVEHLRPQGMTEAEYVSESLRRLRQFARKHELLVIVVAHPKLLEKRADGTYPVPTPYDISGGAMWRNKADNCIAVYANPTDTAGAVEVHVQKVKFKLFGQVGVVHMRWDRVTGLYFERMTKGAW